MMNVSLTDGNVKRYPTRAPNHTTEEPMRKFISRGNVRLAAATWGDAANPPLVLIHGYPDSHAVWNAIAERLADRFYVIAYDVRGAGESSRPRRTAAYRLPELVADFTAVVDDLAPQRAVHVAGHDWGSIQAWNIVADLQATGRIASFTSISGPGLDYIGAELRAKLARPNLPDVTRIVRQLGRSWYIGAFHVPLLAPGVWRAGLGKRWRVVLEQLETLPPDSPYPPADITAQGVHGIKLYRANIGGRLPAPKPHRIAVPVQIVLPTRDPFVGRVLYEGIERWVPDLTFTEIAAGHWAPITHPDTIAALVGNFASAH